MDFAVTMLGAGDDRIPGQLPFCQPVFVDYVETSR